LVLHIEIDPNLEREFRFEVLRRKGAKRGALAEAVEEAIRLWLRHGGG